MNENEPENSGTEGPAEESQRQKPVIAAQLLFVAIAFVWIAFSIVTVVRDSGSSSLTIAGLMLANAAVMVFIAWGLGKGEKRYYYLAVLILGANLFLTVTDEFGLFDIMVLILYLVLLGLLLLTRTYYRNTG